MDIQAIIDKVVGEVQQAPEMLQEIVADPGAAIEKITGHSLGDTDIAAVAEGVLAQVQEKGGDLKEHLSGLMENGAVPRRHRQHHRRRLAVQRPAGQHLRQQGVACCAHTEAPGPLANARGPFDASLE